MRRTPGFRYFSHTQLFFQPYFSFFVILGSYGDDRAINIGKCHTISYTHLSMNIRRAEISDVKAIYSLINFYAEQDEMLFRSMADIYKNLQAFTVVELDGSLVGCCALEIIWSDLAEIKSLAVDEANMAKGIGKMLVGAAAEQARQLGVQRVFALTLKPDFFEKLDFEIVEKETLPMKVWSDCAKCPKQDNCDEVAVIKK
jgi:amino-acid N-acetyltransferase